MSMKSEGTFWEHIEIFRWILIRCAIVIVSIAIIVFVFKDFIFNNIILAPCHHSFITYTTMCHLASIFNMPSLCPDIQSINIININLASQLFTHLSISFYIGLIIGFPYLVIELWVFASPALYKTEKAVAIKAVVAFTLLFFIGIFTAYYIIFPLTVNFLGTYQVSAQVANQISLNSYISSFLTLIFVMGLVFELPIVAYFFAKIGVLNSSFLKKYRKVCIVIVLIAAALITPSTDIFTMLLVAIPLQMLYELSRWVVKKVELKSADIIVEET